MNNERKIFEQAVAAVFEKLGHQVTCRPYGPEDSGRDIIIIVKDREMTFSVEHKKYIAAYQVDQIAKADSPDHPVLVVAQQIAAPAREQLRKKGIAYLEGNGNAFIDNDHTTIFIDGNKPVKEKL